MLKSKLKFLAMALGTIILCLPCILSAAQGDVDGSGKIDLKDVITAIQVCAGITPTSAVHVENDANGDKKIGLAEVIYGLTTISNAPLILPTKTFEESNLSLSYQDETGIIRFLRAEIGYAIAQPIAISPSASPEEAARSFLSVYGSSFGVENQTSELGLLKTETASKGRTFARFQQRYSGIPIIGGELIVQMDAAKSIMSINGEILDFSGRKRNTVNTRPDISAESARQTAIAKVAEVYGKNVSELTATAPELRIYNPVVLGFSEPDTDMLVWHTEVTLSDLTPFNEMVLVEAHSGTIVLNFNQVDTLKQRSTYNASDPNNSTLCRSEDQEPSGDADCDKAHDYAGDAYDFYQREHGRDSIDGKGMKLLSFVHFPLSFFPGGECNAGWNGEFMLYGDGCGFIADDVVAHEITHGVTDHQSDLIYLNQSGAINESFSDIWGEFVDQTNGKGNDTDAVRWKMGEDTSGGAIRDMKNPPVYGHPDRITSDFYKCPECDPNDSTCLESNDRGFVHANSGVGNKAAYLMTDGGTFNGYAVKGLGYAKVADIFYEVQTKLLTSAASYADLCEALIQACSNLGYSTDDCQQVQNALNAVEMYLKPCQSSYPTTTTTSTTVNSTTTTMPTTTTSISTTTTTIPSGGTLVWDSGNWDEKIWN